jgi:CheY-like chemotaxis protein
LGNILVVDDEPAAADFVAANLKVAGFDAVVATGGVQCLTIIDGATPGEQPEGLIIDMLMPEMDGPELVKALGARGSRIPVILMTAHDTERLTVAAEVARAAGLNYVGVLPRPFTIVQLRDLLDALVKSRAATPHGRRPVVMVVGDEPMVRLMAIMTLEDAGFDVIEAADGMDALQIIHSGRSIDLLLTDINMPGMGGFDLAREVSGLLPEVVVVFSSCDCSYSNGKSPSGSNIVFLPKPYKPRDLLRLIKVMFGALPEPLPVHHDQM